MNSLRSLIVYLLVALIARTSGCGTALVVTRPAAVGRVRRSVPMDRALEDRILALDPTKISAADVRDTLSKAPAPRIFLIRGGIYPVYPAMEALGSFVVGV